MIIKADTARYLINIHLLFFFIDRNCLGWLCAQLKKKKEHFPTFLPIRASYVRQSFPIRNKWKRDFILQAVEEVKLRQCVKECQLFVLKFNHFPTTKLGNLNKPDG